MSTHQHEYSWGVCDCGDYQFETPTPRRVHDQCCSAAFRPEPFDDYHVFTKSFEQIMSYIEALPDSESIKFVSLALGSQHVLARQVLFYSAYSEDKTTFTQRLLRFKARWESIRGPYDEYVLTYKVRSPCHCYLSSKDERILL